MEAVLQEFENSIRDYSKQHLVSLCVELKRDNCALGSALKEYRASDTAMARDYQKILDENKKLKAELASTQKALERSQGQNELHNRYRFGAHNEKLDALNITSGDDITDPLSEEQEPEGHVAGPEKKKKKVVAFPEKEKSEEEKKKAAEDREARSHARKMVHDAIGDSRTRKMPTKMNLSGLPHTDTYDINTKALDEEYGEGGWEIVNWHKKDLLRHPMVSHYVETVHTPVIKILATGKLKSSPMPCVLLKRSPVTPEVLAHIIYEKYFKSVPLYRQSADMLNLGLFIPRQDMSNWIVRFSDEYLSVPYYYMQKLQCARKYGQCDESTLQVLHEPDRDARTKSYVWVHTTGELDDEGNPIVIFVYEPTRGTDHLRSYYASFSGALSSDAYGAYSLLSKESCGRILNCGCFMHARRRFAEALEVIKIGRLSREQIEALPEYKALVLIGKIYEAEGKLKSLSPEERLDGRIKTVRPLVDAYFSFLEGFDTADPLLSERMKDAISYSLNQKEQLCRFLEDGRIPCDNGYAENSIRLYAQGRRNWLFSNTPSGAMASATVYSLVETARRNNANPLIYIKYLLEKTVSYLELPSGSPRLEELMPWSETYRSYEESEKQKCIDLLVPKSQKRPHYRHSRKSGSDNVQAAC